MRISIAQFIITATIMANVCPADPMVKPVLADDSLVKVLASSCRITQKDESGTAFFVQLAANTKDNKPRTVLVTTAHAMEKMPDAECMLILREKRPDGSWARKEFSVPVRSSGKPLWAKHPDQDIAVLPMELPADANITPFQLNQLSDEQMLSVKKISVGQEVWVPCYPAKTEANEAGWPILRRGTIATYPLLPVNAAKTFFIDISIFGGDSGAPVVIMTKENPVVAGMLIGMQRQTDKTSVPFEERTMHTPLGLAIVVQAQFIRETIQMTAGQISPTPPVPAKQDTPALPAQ